MPFSADIPPQALHPHPGHREAVARIHWCIGQRQMGVITGEVGAGKTVAARAALAGLEASRHQVIYLPDPTITMRGIHATIVTALGGQPSFFSGVLATQTAALLAGELDERSRLPVVVIDEAHLLSNTELESLRMLTNTRPGYRSHFALLLIGQPTLRRRLKMAVLAALDQRIGTRFTLNGMNLADTSQLYQGPSGIRGQIGHPCSPRMPLPPSTRPPGLPAGGEQPRRLRVDRHLRRQQDHRGPGRGAIRDHRKQRIAEPGTDDDHAVSKTTNALPKSLGRAFLWAVRRQTR